MRNSESWKRPLGSSSDSGNRVASLSLISSAVVIHGLDHLIWCLPGVRSVPFLPPLTSGQSLRPEGWAPRGRCGRSRAEGVTVRCQGRISILEVKDRASSMHLDHIQLDLMSRLPILLDKFSKSNNSEELRLGKNSFSAWRFLLERCLSISCCSLSMYAFLSGPSSCSSWLFPSCSLYLFVSGEWSCSIS